MSHPATLSPILVFWCFVLAVVGLIAARMLRRPL
jgi:hypothetical protein